MEGSTLKMGSYRLLENYSSYSVSDLPIEKMTRKNNNYIPCLWLSDRRGEICLSLEVADLYIEVSQRNLSQIFQKTSNEKVRKKIKKLKNKLKKNR